MGIRFRVLRLIHGGSQCEEMKNITKHCTPHDFPFGTHWLIQEHRKCIAELNRLGSCECILDVEDDNKEFWELLGGKGEIKPAEAVEEVARSTEKKMYVVSDASGIVKVKEVPLT